MDLKSLHKLETIPYSSQPAVNSDSETVSVLVKLKKGHSRPPYVVPRAQISDEMFSAQVRTSELSRLEEDEAVESMSLSRALPVIP